MGLARDVLADVVACQQILALAETRGYAREEHGKLQEVSGYEIHRMLGEPEHRQDVYAYSHNRFAEINAAYREGTGRPLDHVFASASPAARPFTVYRRIGYQGPARSFQSGDVVEDKAPASTSTEPTALPVFHGQVLRMHVPAGTRAVSVLSARQARHKERGVKGMDPKWDEDQEVLLPPGMRYQVTGIDGRFADASPIP